MDADTYSGKDRTRLHPLYYVSPVLQLLSHRVCSGAVLFECVLVCAHLLQFEHFVRGFGLFPVLCACGKHQSSWVGRQSPSARLFQCDFHLHFQLFQ